MEFWIKNLIVPALTGIIAGVMGYILGWKKNKAEISKIDTDTDLAKIKSLNDIIESWQKFADRLEDRLAKQTKIIEEQDAKLETQTELIEELQQKIEELKQQIEQQCLICNNNKTDA